MFLIIDFGSAKTQNIAAILGTFGYKYRVTSWNSDHILDPHKTSGIILSGAPILLTQIDPKAYLDKYNFLIEIELPVLGICFGHQLIGLLHGAEAFLGPENRSNKMINHNGSSLFKGLSNPCEMMEDHTEGITLPKRFKKIGSSKDYPLEAMQHETKKVFGVQFHPEVSEENGSNLLNNFCQLALK